MKTEKPKLEGNDSQKKKKKVVDVNSNTNGGQCLMKEETCRKCNCQNHFAVYCRTKINCV